MNILFFILPKEKTQFLYDTFTLRQALEKFDTSGYTSLPVINEKGEYLYTITEGDMLRFVKQKENLSIKVAERIPLKDVQIKREVKSIKVYSNIEDLLELSLSQNFVPVVDDMDHYIGIITRRSIISHFYKNLKLGEK